MKGNMLIVHGGAPTAVINASLYGAVTEAKKHSETGTVYGARGGAAAIIRGDFINLSQMPENILERLPYTPASYIGTSRDHISEADYDKIVDALAERNIRYLLFNGGNGSMDTCGKIAKRAKERGITVFTAGIPKTIDNDIAVTDHAPGFGSAARYIASSVQELAQDIASLPIHVCIIETMGRNAGWLTAAAALSGADGRFGPHLVYVPEIPFNEDAFLDNAKTLFDRYGGVLVVASEGLKKENGEQLVPPIFKVGRSVYYGDVSAHLCNLVIRKLGIKARSEKPGVLGRCSIAYQSDVDREEAITAGREAAKAAIAEKNAVMVGFRRISNEPYACETFLIPVEEVMLHERTLPREYVNKTGDGIMPEFLDWCRPLAGASPHDFALLK